MSLSQFFNSLAKSRYLDLFDLFSILLSGQMGQQNPQFCESLTITPRGHPLAKSRYLDLFDLFSILLSGQMGQQNPQFCELSFFLLIIIRSGRLAEIRWSIYISKYQGSLRVSFSRTDARLCIYHLFVWSNFSFFNNYQWIILRI